jgi:tripartite-type tricarboxylate transporter receptor subunit TctC
VTRQRLRLFALAGALTSTVLVGGAFSTSPPVPSSARTSLGFSTLTLLTSDTAGGSNDTLGRLMQPTLQKDLGVTVVVKDDIGAAGFVAGNDAIVDGANCSSILDTNVQQMQYDFVTSGVPFKASDFRFLNNVLEDYNSIIVAKSSPYQTFSAMVAAAKASPGKITVGVNDLQTANGAGLLGLEKASGVKFDVVPFGGSGQAARTALLGGHLDAVSASMFASQGVAAEINFLAVQAQTNDWKPITEDAPTMTKVIGKTIPTASSLYAFAVSASCATKHPAAAKAIQKALISVSKSKALAASYVKLGEAGVIDLLTGPALQAAINESAKLTHTPTIKILK